MQTSNVSPFAFLAVFISVFLIVWSLGKVLIYYSNKQKLEASKNKGDATSQGFLLKLHSALTDLINACKGNKVLKRLFAGKSERHTVTLHQAGSPGNLTSDEIILMQFLLPLVLLILGFLFFPLEIFHFVFLVATLSYFIPVYLLKKRAKERVGFIKNNFPDALDSFSLSMNSGLSINQAIEYYVEDDSRNPLQEEFAYVQAETVLGIPFSEAIVLMADRINIEEMTSFSSIVRQSLESGVPVVKRIEEVSEKTKTRNFSVIEEQSQKAPAKMMIPLVLFILPSVFIMILGPLGLNYLNRGG